MKIVILIDTTEKQNKILIKPKHNEKITAEIGIQIIKEISNIENEIIEILTSLTQI